MEEGRCIHDLDLRDTPTPNVPRVLVHGSVAGPVSGCQHGFPTVCGRWDKTRARTRALTIMPGKLSGQRLPPIPLVRTRPYEYPACQVDVCRRAVRWSGPFLVSRLGTAPVLLGTS